MFVTLLNGARYLELLARRRATAAIRTLARSAPLVATRVPGSGGGRGAGGGMESRTGVEAGGRAGIESPSGRGRAKDWAENEIPSGNGAGNRAGIESPGGSGAGDGTGNRAGTATTSGSKAGDRTEGTPSGNGAGSEGAGTMAGRVERVERTEGAERVERVPAAALRPGDRVRVRPGEVVPADGVIRSGHSAFDEALLTGESNPAPRSAGETVLAGSVNGSGVVEVEVRCAGDETVLGGVLRRAGQAARERPAIAPARRPASSGRRATGTHDQAFQTRSPVGRAAAEPFHAGAMSTFSMKSMPDPYTLPVTPRRCRYAGEGSGPAVPPARGGG